MRPEITTAVVLDVPTRDPERENVLELVLRFSILGASQVADGLLQMSRCDHQYALTCRTHKGYVFDAERCRRSRATPVKGFIRFVKKENIA
jgi:hypothetical protein